MGAIATVGGFAGKYRLKQREKLPKEAFRDDLGARVRSREIGRRRTIGIERESEPKPRSLGSSMRTVAGGRSGEPVALLLILISTLHVAAETARWMCATAGTGKKRQAYTRTAYCENERQGTRTKKTG